MPLGFAKAHHQIPLEEKVGVALLLVCCEKCIVIVINIFVRNKRSLGLVS